MLNAESIKLRLIKLDECIRHLENLQRYSLEEYLANPMVQGWTERLFQVSIECCIDIASHTIAGYGLKRPAYRRDVFTVLSQEGYLEADFAADMVEMGKLRNRLVHLYWDIDPEEMYKYLQEDVALLKGFRAFALAVLDELRDSV
jgi:uncharacterized protein YutE (UPF0331/DUF86 family)